MTYETNNSIANIKANLSKAEDIIKETIDLSIKSLNERPELEEELIELLFYHGKQISDYFFKEAESTGNDKLAKNLIKHFMFKRF
ncbi:hypothetical protein [Serpentinicella alkaliphila]|uniref:Uncharacterized protein n=1 Tax=Serpentinicella alkaliphila TaxID=1734049 RepID=A0A4R2TDS0_9FIRM|nr:hypothetical protein [Serpentinicella alkaliphila]QUH25855.1 hypothetical protein HZR23_08975 [Serpentinicella alkaliphila]TCP95298.1 hypothetical protein EDD79_10614 [Serpentinicella alkaliphila]